MSELTASLPDPDSPAAPAVSVARVRRPDSSQPGGVLPALQSLLYFLVVALFVMTFTVQPIRIPSASMEPTLLVGDFLLLDKQSASPSAGGLLPPSNIRRGDLIVFHDPVDDPTIHLVKRVVALPGDRLHLRDGVLFLNGVPQQEPFAVHQPTAEDTFRDDFPTLESIDPGVNPAWWARLRGLIQDGEITVPPGDYFVMGDNRNNSEDSRYWGFVPRAAIVGKPLLIYFSWKDPSSTSAPQEMAGDRNGLHTPSPVPTGVFDFARWDRTFQVVH